MKLPLLTAAIAGAAAVSAGPTPPLFDLRSSTTNLPGLIWNPLMYANGSAYIGNIKYNVYSEPLLLTGGPEEYGHSFTSIHSAPTGWQNLYVFANASRAIGFTTPHSGYVPPGAQLTGYGANAAGLLTLDRGKGAEQRWRACKVVEGTWQIFWEGAATLGACTAVTLRVGKATECRLPQSA